MTMLPVLITLADTEADLELVAVILRLAGPHHADLLGLACGVASLDLEAARPACVVTLESRIAGLEDGCDVVPEGRAELGGCGGDWWSEKSAVGFLGRVVLLPDESGGVDVGGVVGEIEDSIGDWIDGIDAESWGTRCWGHGWGDVGHADGVLRVAIVVVRVRNLELIQMGMAVEHGGNGGLVAVDDLVEDIGGAVEVIGGSGWNVGDNVDVLAGIFSALELVDEPGELAVRVGLHGLLVHPEVKGVVEDGVKRDDAEVATWVLNGVCAVIISSGSSSGADPLGPVTGERVICPLCIKGRGDGAWGKAVNRGGVVVTHGWVDKVEAGEDVVGGAQILKNFWLVNAPDIVCDNVTGEDSERRIWNNGLDSSNHALLKGLGWITERVAELASWVVGVSGSIIGRVRAAANWLGAVIVGTDLVLQINVSVTDVNKLDWGTSADCRTLLGWLCLWECDCV